MNTFTILQKREQYHQKTTNLTIQKEMKRLQEVFKDIIFLYGILDDQTEEYIKHIITEGIPMLMRPMGKVKKTEKERYEQLVLSKIEEIKRKILLKMIIKEEEHEEIVQKIIDRLVEK